MTIKMYDEKRTREVLSRVDKYISLMRFKFTEEEKLVRLNSLNRFYEQLHVSPVEEITSSSIEVAESLSGKLVLPLKVRGIFLSEGRPKRKFYKAEDLKIAAENPLNQKFPLMLDHKDKEAGKIIGVVTKIEYDDSIKGLRWWGHINDETFARNVIDKAITEVSATIYSEEDFDDMFGLIGTNLGFKELSLVMDGAEPQNMIEVDD